MRNANHVNGKVLECVVELSIFSCCYDVSSVVAVYLDDRSYSICFPMDRHHRDRTTSFSGILELSQ